MSRKKDHIERARQLIGDNAAIEIPFGAIDSELCGWEYTIPEGMEAVVKDGKVIVRRTEIEDEKIRKALIHLINEQDGFLTAINGISVKDIIAYLEKQKEHKWYPSEGEMGVLYKLCYISNQITDEDDTELTRLYQDLKREYFNGHSFENMFLNERQKERITEETKQISPSLDIATSIRTSRIETLKNLLSYLKYERKSTQEEINISFIPCLENLLKDAEKYGK